jgi:hypothetical protein
MILPSWLERRSGNRFHFPSNTLPVRLTRRLLGDKRMVRVQFRQTKVPVSFTSVDENVFLRDIKKDTDPLLSHLITDQSQAQLRLWRWLRLYRFQ